MAGFHHYPPTVSYSDDSESPEGFSQDRGRSQSQPDPEYLKQAQLLHQYSQPSTQPIIYHNFAPLSPSSTSSFSQATSPTAQMVSTNPPLQSGRYGVVRSSSSISTSGMLSPSLKNSHSSAGFYPPAVNIPPSSSLSASPTHSGRQSPKYYSTSSMYVPAGVAGSGGHDNPPPHIHILVVDDVSTNLKVAGLALKRLGHEYTLCSSGDHALAILAALNQISDPTQLHQNLARLQDPKFSPFAARLQPQLERLAGTELPDVEQSIGKTPPILNTPHAVSLIMMDIQMPDINGLDTTLLIRLLGCHIPILAYTANGPSSRDDCEISMMQGILDKPLAPATFGTTLNNYLNSSASAPPSRPALSPQQSLSTLPAPHEAGIVRIHTASSTYQNNNYHAYSPSHGGEHATN